MFGAADAEQRVHVQVESLARAMELGEEAAERVTKEFPPPVKLEFEKVRSASATCRVNTVLSLESLCLRSDPQ